MHLSVVVPLHDEAANVVELSDRLRGVLDRSESEWDVVLVDDGSTDATWREVQAVACSDPRFRGLRLARNFGHQAALTAGLRAADGDAVITMDGDLQHPPEIIPRLLQRAAEGYDVVYAVRGEDDAEGWFKVRSAAAFYWLLTRLTSLDLPRGGADFRYMSRQVVDVLSAMPERHRFLRGMTRWIGLRQAIVSYDRAARRAGRSKYGLVRMTRFASDAILSFSALPLKIASVLGILTSVLGWLYLIYVIAVRVMSEATVPGWTSVVAAVLILGGIQLACIGIIGQYLGRMYEELKGRPLYVVWEDTFRMGATRNDSSVSTKGFPPPDALDDRHSLRLPLH